MLTDDEIFNIGREVSRQYIKDVPEFKLVFARAIEAAAIAAVDAERSKEAVAWLHNSRNNSDVITSAVKKLIEDQFAAYGFDSPVHRHPASKAENYTIPLYLSPSIPEGYALVPIEPTPKIFDESI